MEKGGGGGAAWGFDGGYVEGGQGVRTERSQGGPEEGRVGRAIGGPETYGGTSDQGL